MHRTFVTRKFLSGNRLKAIVLSDDYSHQGRHIVKSTKTSETDEFPALSGGARIERCLITGFPVLVPPPGTPPLTSEIVEELLEDFP
jgi:hypothetical protein